MKNYELKDNAVEQRYEFDLDGEKAVIEYAREPDLIVLIHTYVPPAYEGRGIGRTTSAAIPNGRSCSTSPLRRSNPGVFPGSGKSADRAAGAVFCGVRIRTGAGRGIPRIFQKKRGKGWIL